MKVFVAVALIVMSSQAASQNDLITVDGRLDCGQWIEARTGQRAAVFESYVVGSINGMAIGRRMDLWNYRGVRTSRTQIFYWLDSFCAKNPLKEVIQGLMDFADERTQGAWLASYKK